MGVIYKLTDEVVAFILEQKRQETDLSCRELVERVAARFQRVVSKSSVNDVLREANILSQRGRKQKNKFQIPQEKKAELIAGLPPAIQASIPMAPALITPPPQAPTVPKDTEPLGVAAQEENFSQEDQQQDEAPREASQEEPLSLRVEPMVVQDPPPPPVVTTAQTLPLLEEGQDPADARQFFHEAAFQDLFPVPNTRYRSSIDLASQGPETLAQERAYRLQYAASYRVELEDGSGFFIDARTGCLAREAHPPIRLAPIETAVVTFADTIHNNVRPLCVGAVLGEHLDAASYDMFAAMQNLPGKKIVSVRILDPDGNEMLAFSSLPRMMRTFVLGVPVTNKDMEPLYQSRAKPLLTVNSYFTDGPVRYYVMDAVFGGTDLRALVIVDHQELPRQVLLTNTAGNMSANDVLLTFLNAHPLSPPNVPTLRSGSRLSETNVGISIGGPGLAFPGFPTTFGSPRHEGAKAFGNDTLLNIIEEDMVKSHAKYLFGEIVDDPSKERLSQIRCRMLFNAKVKIIRYSDAMDCKHLSALDQANNIINNIEFFDYAGRRFWVRAG